MQLHTRVRTLWQIGAAAGAGVAVVAAGAAAGVVAGVTGNRWGLALVAVLAAVVVPVALLRPRYAYRAWRYDLTADALEIRHGVWWQVHSVIPYARVQNVDITSGPLERALGLRTLALRTASASTDATIPGIDEQAAGELRRVILDRAGHDDAA